MGTVLRAIRNRHLFVWDAVTLGIIPFILVALRRETLILRADDLQTAARAGLLSIPTMLLVYHSFGLYRRLWRYASTADMELVAAAVILGSLLVFAESVGIPLVLPEFKRLPLSLWFNGCVLSLLAFAGPRLYMRAGGRRSVRRTRRSNAKRVLIAGAGSAGQMILKEISRNTDLQIVPVGFVDDDSAKHGLHIGRVPILGPLADIPSLIDRERIEELIIAMPGTSGTVVRGVVRAALDAGIGARTVPGLVEILSGSVSINTLRKVQIDDLLRREPVQIDFATVSALAADRTVLVTGAGGSIGSELARQIAPLGPSKLVLLGHGENPIFDILNELRAKFPSTTIVPVIADVRDRSRIFDIWNRHRPFAVFHAAAHKHVPLMEENVIEAVTNNVVGTRNVVDASVETNVSHFVLISTDKAVRPTNVMGATKRVAEHVVRRAALKHHRNFVAVRFGNVLGSRGSVVPTFVKQIKMGGPVTVTHPDMRRYFMTIPEAVQLVMQAGAIGRGGELFMLDMGEPVRVVDLARDLIRLSGLEEGSDIEIRFTGIRPGEKLYEEMFFSDELAVPTSHPKVLRARKSTLDQVDEEQISALTDAAGSGASEDLLRNILKELVPDFSGVTASILADTPAFGVRLVSSDTPVETITALSRSGGVN